MKYILLMPHLVLSFKALVTYIQVESILISVHAPDASVDSSHQNAITIKTHHCFLHAF
jgi:hypothetical protein